MATPALPGKRRDVAVLREARRKNNEAVTKAESALLEIDRMRESMGRPDYSRISSLMADLSLALTKTAQHLDEMWELRETVRRDNVTDDKLTEMQMQLDELRKAIGMR